MKKIMIVLLAVLLAFGVVCAKDTGEKAYEVTEQSYPFYLGSVDSLWDGSFPLYFINGVNDVPYISLESLSDFLVTTYHSNDDLNYELTLKVDGPDAVLVRENGYYMAMDFDADTITFNDYNAFRLQSSKTTLIDLLSTEGVNEAGEAALFLRDQDASYSRYGDMYTIDLSSYGIDLVAQDGSYYIPLQTASDILIAPAMKNPILFNGQAMFFANDSKIGDVKYGLTPLGELYYSAGPVERSEALAEFGYKELCLALDNIYGLKEVHDIKSFDQVFHQIAYDQLLKGQDPEYADKALNSFIGYFLDDGHSQFHGYSWQVGEKEFSLAKGPGKQKMYDAWDYYGDARTAVYGQSFLPYEEVGNTAYITFDMFSRYLGDEDYYAYNEGEELPPDTIALIIEAHKQITRENSPIENVVIDLSNNGGGAVDSAIFVLSWMLGEAPITVKDQNTGAMSTAIYRADVNLDGQFDEKDTITDRKLYCLISPISFSCGNLVPAALKASDKVTLLGRTSGGGSCVVQHLSTAWGTMFDISGSYRMSFLKNGSFYDIDQGVAPDYTISTPAKFYDREALTDFINNKVF